MSTFYRAFLSGTITNNPLSAVSSTITSSQFAALPQVTGTDQMWLVLDPTGTGGAPEIVMVTAHTSASTSITVVRGQQTTKGGGAARSHAAGTTWVHALTPADIGNYQITNSGARPPVNSTGALIYEPDTGRLMNTNGTSWEGVKTTSHAVVGITFNNITAPVVTANLTVPDQGCSGKLNLWASCLLSGSTAPGDIYHVTIKEAAVGGVAYGQGRFQIPTSNFAVQGFAIGSVLMTAGSGKNPVIVVERAVGSGSCNVVNDYTLHRIEAIFVPD